MVRSVKEIIDDMAGRENIARESLEEFIAAIIDEGYTIIKSEERDRMVCAMYRQYKLRRAANEMFRAHLGLREYGDNVPTATSKQMVEWQAVLSGEDDAE